MYRQLMNIVISYAFLKVYIITMIIDDCIFKLVWQKEIFVIYRNKEKKKRNKMTKISFCHNIGLYISVFAVSIGITVVAII